MYALREPSRGVPSETAGPAIECLPCPSIARIGNDRSAPADAAAVDKRLGIVDWRCRHGQSLLYLCPVANCGCGTRLKRGNRSFEEEGFFGIPLGRFAM